MAAGEGLPGLAPPVIMGRPPVEEEEVTALPLQQGGMAQGWPTTTQATAGQQAGGDAPSAEGVPAALGLAMPQPSPVRGGSCMHSAYVATAA